MEKYYSPKGNPEIWEEKPDAYFTEEEWMEAHPPQAPDLEEMRRAEILSRLEQLDRDGMRPVEELADDRVSEADKKAATEKLAAINRDKAELRQELSSLSVNDIAPVAKDAGGSGIDAL